jgi:non-ribosomal peptide synthetase component F
MIVLEPAVPPPAPGWSLHQMEGEIGNAVGATKLDLELELDERPEGHLAGRLIYDRDLFDASTAERVLAHWAHVVAALAADPSQPVSRVPLASAVEVERRVAEFNATATIGATDAVAALAEELDLGPADTVLVLARTPEALALPLAVGARVLVAEGEPDGAQLSALIRREGVTFMHAAPDEWQHLVDTGLRAGRSLRALSGGGRLTRALADALLDRCRVVWNAHGSPDYATLGRVERDGPVTIGRPLPNQRAEVVDRHDRPAPIGVFGELRLNDAPAGRARWLPDGRLELR